MRWGRRDGKIAFPFAVAVAGMEWRKDGGLGKNPRNDNFCRTTPIEDSGRESCESGNSSDRAEIDS